MDYNLKTKIWFSNLLYDIKWFIRKTFNIGEKHSVECPNCYARTNLLYKSFGIWVGKCVKCKHELILVVDIYPNRRNLVRDLTLSNKQE